MSRSIVYISLLVRDYDEAIDYFTGKLGFELVEDRVLTEVKRWVVVRPPGGGTSLLLARARDGRQRRFVGDQSGGRVFLFLETKDFFAEYSRLKANGVRFMENPRTEEYGTVAVFEDLYGNRWDLLELKQDG